MMMQRFFFFLIVVLFSLSTLAQPKVVAHRGYWRAEGSAQNSIASLREAARVGCWGSEFDVWLTADGVPVVFHDGTIDGIRIEDTTYATLMNHRLQNGEFIPTLQQYLLEATRLPALRLIFEIKAHRTEKRDRQVAELCVELIEALHLADRTDYISFSRHVCRRLHELVPDAHVAYLSGDIEPADIKKLGWTGIDYSIKAFNEHPLWPQEAKKLGLEVNVWTVDGEENLRRFIATEGIDIITTNDPEVLLNLLKQ